VNIEQGDEPRPVEFVSVRGYGVPLPFTTSSIGPPEPSEPSEPQTRRRWLRVLIAAGLPVVLVAALYLTVWTGTEPGAAAKPAAATPSPTRSKSPAEAKEDLINQGLAAQSQALLGGDLTGYLAFVDTALNGEFTQRFHSLRALRVARWTAQVADMPLDEDDRWSVTVKIGYCLGDADCVPAEMVLPSTWTVRDGRAVATTFQRTVLPWDLTALQAVAGRRVIVAAPASLAGQLDRTLAAADTAADAADRFARWGPPPKWYIVYLAGPEQWRTWWNGRSEGFDGYAMGSYGVAIQPGAAGSGLTNLLAHEFTHVVSVGDEDHASWSWWLAEGLAEYAADRDGSWTRARLPFVRRYLRAGRWDGTVTLGDTLAGVSEDELLARYGLALLTVTCLARRFGEDRLLAFFASVVREWTDPETASLKVFGTEWAPVAAGCAAEIRVRAK
jgi:hypothetical protein